MITAWTYTIVLVDENSTELEGTDVVIGIYEEDNEKRDKQKASNEHNIPLKELKAYHIV